MGRGDGTLAQDVLSGWVSQIHVGASTDRVPQRLDAAARVASVRGHMRAFALLLTVLTGFAGLVYEVTWQRYLATLLGAQSEATAAILAVFLGGLSIGYALFGRISRRETRGGRLLAIYGAVEAAIGLYALAFPLLFALVQGASTQLAIGNSALAFAFDVALAALLIGPPAVLMGATIPMLTQGMTRSLDDATRWHALVYGFNTIGAFAGALAAGFWLIPAFGLVGALRAMAAVNLVAGASFALLARRGGAATAPAAAQPAAQPGNATVAGFAIYAWVAGLVGFAMLTLQTVLIRLGGLSLGSSQFTFSLVVAVFVLCIALGSLLVSQLPRISPRALLVNQWLLATYLGLLYLVMENVPYATHVLRSLVRSDPHAMWLFFPVIFLALLVLIGPPVMMSGAVLPMLFHHLRREAADLGAIAGRLYSWNTVGSVAGALLGGYLLFFWLDLEGVFRVAVAALVVAAGLLALQVSRLRYLALIPVLPGLVALALLPAWSTYKLSVGAFRFRAPEPATYQGADAFYSERQQRTGEKILFYKDDPIASVAVREFHYGDKTSRAIISNGKSDGALIGDYPTMALAALIPALFAEKAERVLTIGWGTGVTVGELAALDSVKQVDVAEISSGVIDAAFWFESGNLGASQNPKVKITRTDAYRALHQSRGDYDIIVSEPSNPWVAGVEMLFSREFLEAARNRLAPGGVYVQWFPTYETDDETVALVLRTFTSVFPDNAIWYTTGPDLLLLGFKSPGDGDLERILERIGKADFKAGFERAGVTSAAALLAHELLPRGVAGSLDLAGPIHTLLHPILADRSARAFFAGGKGDVPSTTNRKTAEIGAKNSLLRRSERRQDDHVVTADREAAVRETCRFRPRECSVRFAQWLAEVPGSDIYRRNLDDVRRNPPPGVSIDERLIMNLALLFKSDHADAEPGTELQVAEQASDLFLHYYDHAAPFRRTALGDFWSQCEKNPATAERCKRERTHLEQQLGDLNTDVAPAVPGAPH